MQRSVLEYLEETAKRLPDKVAFFDAETEITFAELREKAIDVAFDLMGKLNSRRNPILVYLPKTVSSIIAFMGVLYSGNFYTPTDIRFPKDKLESVVDELQPKAVIVNSKTEQRLHSLLTLDNSIILINLDAIPCAGQYNEASYLIQQILDTDPVYTFFTSGSTGIPKGVIINNHNVIDYIDWAADVFGISEKTVMGNQSPFYFDISTQDIYTTLKTGATLGIIPVSYFAFPIEVLQFINEKKINFLYWVPSAFVNIANMDLLSRVKLEQVELIMFGGEVMPVKQLNYWKRHLPNLKTIANVYGPTEATVNCTYYIVDREFAENEVLPLGKACENTGLVVLDDSEQVINSSMVNVPGELCVYGSSLSDGYWNDNEKTDDKFVPNPLCKHYRQRMYRTGDLVYYNNLGELVFQGRKDFQIKHMGYRIELGEIETAAMGMTGIRNVCASYHDEKKEIVLFYQGDVKQGELVDYLSSVLAKYMLPTIYKKLEHFPYNDNGKIDRNRISQLL